MIEKYIMKNILDPDIIVVDLENKKYKILNGKDKQWKNFDHYINNTTIKKAFIALDEHSVKIPSKKRIKTFFEKLENMSLNTLHNIEKIINNNIGKSYDEIKEELSTDEEYLITFKEEEYKCKDPYKIENFKKELNNKKVVYITSPYYFFKNNILYAKIKYLAPKSLDEIKEYYIYNFILKEFGSVKKEIQAIKEYSEGVLTKKELLDKIDPIQYLNIN